MKFRIFPVLLFSFILLGLVACKNEKTKDSTDTKGELKETKMDDVVQKNIETTRSFYPMFEKGDWAGIEKICAPSFQDHSPMVPPGTASNRDSLMKYLKATREAYPDMKMEVLHAAGTDDMVFVHYHFTGTNTGSFLGMPPTNKKIDYMGVDLLRIKDGQAVEHWDYADNVTYMKQMGMLPED
jgi:predicted SnoaL-like aldol condensation-catalyzing enzyme